MRIFVCPALGGLAWRAILGHNGGEESLRQRPRVRGRKTDVKSSTWLAELTGGSVSIEIQPAAA